MSHYKAGLWLDLFRIANALDTKVPISLFFLQTEKIVLCDVGR